MEASPRENMPEGNIKGMTLQEQFPYTGTSEYYEAQVGNNLGGGCADQCLTTGSLEEVRKTPDLWHLPITKMCTRGLHEPTGAGPTTSETGTGHLGARVKESQL